MTDDYLNEFYETIRPNLTGALPDPWYVLRDAIEYAEEQGWYISSYRDAAKRLWQVLVFHNGVHDGTAPTLPEAVIRAVTMAAKESRR